MTVTHILAATDGSETATEMIVWVAELATQTTASVSLVHVFEPLAHLDEDDDGRLDLRALRRRVDEHLRTDWSAPLREREVAYDTLVVEGRPAQAIADAAHDIGADLIVIGARGLSPVQRFVLGSTSQKLPVLTHVPVTVFRAAGDS
ncbi:MAG: universal stress protein [Acidimicrobiales bacterium]